ncbi:MAG TPA: hypothetical protein VGX26_06480 [Solirubrobacteraceae bacterium]|jgi:hypothetical protein|nr:hypothetical protein [Solirubrobacteraceae bacterium]
MEIVMTVDATDRTISEEIVRARDALIQLAREEPEDRWWTAHELAVCARNGWSSAVVDLALRELLDEGIFEQRPDLQVRLVRPPT